MTHRAALIAELDAHKDKVIAHYAEQERQAAAEAELSRYAAMWQRLAATDITRLADMVQAAPATDAFLANFEQ